ncbi:MAG TPA: zinc-ribbon domain-containing protein [Candidatus Hydrogenedentes bacterium]|nr:zinc-ribbon domain-containing protein [Candidatus Hydrogenedentota bacterium]
MSSQTLYLVVMVGIIAVITAISVPSLFFKKCPKCGRRNLLKATACSACGTELPPHES